MGVIRFYEGPSATQHYIGKLSSDVSQTGPNAQGSIGEFSSTLLYIDPAPIPIHPTALRPPNGGLFFSSNSSLTRGRFLKVEDLQNPLGANVTRSSTKSHSYTLSLPTSLIGTHRFDPSLSTHITTRK